MLNLATYVVEETSTAKATKTTESDLEAEAQVEVSQNVNAQQDENAEKGARNNIDEKESDGAIHVLNAIVQDIGVNLVQQCIPKESVSLQSKEGNNPT